MTEKSNVVSMVEWAKRMKQAVEPPRKAWDRQPNSLSPPVRLCYPTSIVFETDDGDVVVDPTKKTADLVLRMQKPASGRPSVYAHAGGVVLDMGDCTDARTAVRLTPDVALQWSEALMRYASIARLQ